MVKVTFNSSLGQKEPKKDLTDESLIPAESVDVEDGLPVHRRQSRLWWWCLCLALILSAVVVGGAYLYRSSLMQEDPVYFCGVDYYEEDYMMEDVEVQEAGEMARLRHIEESIRVLEEEAVELITVPVPEFSESDPADIVHDFNKRLTAYLDLTLNKCYIISLNTSIVMPPKDFQELLNNIKARTYLPQSYLVHEQMTVTEKVDNMDELGYFIYSLCLGRETYRLTPRAPVLGIQKRDVLNCRKIRHFENTFVVETQICEP